jgi:hypothetical protein
MPSLGGTRIRNINPIFPVWAGGGDNLHASLIPDDIRKVRDKGASLIIHMYEKGILAIRRGPWFWSEQELLISEV